MIPLVGCTDKESNSNVTICIGLTLIRAKTYARLSILQSDFSTAEAIKESFVLFIVSIIKMLK